MGIATASFNHVVYCNEPEPVLVVKRVAGHCIVMNCIVSPRYQSPPAYLVAAPRPRSSDGPARCLLTVNKTNFGIINIFVSPSPSSPPLPIKERTMLQFRQCVTIWSCVCRRRIWEELGQLCLSTLSDYPEYVIRLSAGQPDRLDLDVVTICLMDPGGDAWRVLGLRPHLTTSNHICLLLLYKQHTT